MKILITAILLLSVSSVSAATTVLGGTKKGGGGVTLAYNSSSQQVEVLPQCFPWVWASEYFEMNIANMYANQEACRTKRSIDFNF